MPVDGNSVISRLSFIRPRRYSDYATNDRLPLTGGRAAAVSGGAYQSIEVQDAWLLTRVLTNRMRRWKQSAQRVGRGGVCV